MLKNGFSIMDNGNIENIQSGTVRIDTPFPCVVLVNGVKYAADTYVAYVPVSSLKSLNTVKFIAHNGKQYDAERFKYESGCVSPCGYDFRETIIALKGTIDELSAQIADMRNTLMKHNEAIYQGELY